MRKLSCRMWIVAAALVFSACTVPKSHPFELDEALVGAPGVETVGLLPLNALATLPAELDSATFRVTQQIRDHLARCGRKIRYFSMGEARGLWSEVSAEGTEAASANGEKVVRYVQRLRETRAFDVLVVPSLAFREAPIRLSAQEAVWDGVVRKLSMKGAAHSAGVFHGDMKIRGKAQGVSLHVVAYDAAGARVFDGYGGLDLIHEWELGTEYQTDRNMHRYAVPVADIRLMRKRLGDEANLREGVALAFDPYLVPVGEPVSTPGAH